MFKRKNTSSIGIIGNPDEETIKYLEEKTGKTIKKIVKRGKTKIVIGKGLFKKKIKVD